MKRHETYWVNKDGSIPKESEEKLRQLRKSFAGQLIRETLDNERIRSNQQNRYLFGVVYPLIQSYAQHFGQDYTISEWHEYYVSKGYFGTKEMNGDMIPKRSHESTTQEFSEAKTRLQQNWAEKGLVIPDPLQENFL